jgi:hypothetical protein
MSLLFSIIIRICVDEEHNMKEENKNKNKEYKVIHAVLRERKTTRR